MPEPLLPSDASKIVIIDCDLQPNAESRCQMLNSPSLSSMYNCMYIVTIPMSRVPLQVLSHFRQGDDYHASDIHLFWENIRQHVILLCDTMFTKSSRNPNWFNDLALQRAYAPKATLFEKNPMALGTDSNDSHVTNSTETVTSSIGVLQQLFTGEIVGVSPQLPTGTLSATASGIGQMSEAHVGGFVGAVVVLVAWGIGVISVILYAAGKCASVSHNTVHAYGPLADQAHADEWSQYLDVD